MRYQVNDTWFHYSATGDKMWGSEKVLLSEAHDLVAGKAWSNSGYTIEKLFEDRDHALFSRQVYDLLVSLWIEAGLAVPPGFQLHQYHTLAGNFDTHLRAVERTKLLSVEKFPLGISAVEQRISELLGVDVRALNPYDNQSIFHFRIIRPFSKDNNPLHRDVWLDDYESCINLYIPVAGSNALSSLILLPGSHYWPESRVERTVQGAVIEGIKFNVPAVTDIRGEYTLVRPDPKENEVMIFSPYLIHGGAVNLNADTTRISIEMRLWKK